MDDKCAGRANQRGMVTIELAVGILTATVLTALLCWMVALVVTQSKCIDVATEVARQTARGDSDKVRLARELAPRDSRIDVTRRQHDVTVVVSVDSRFMGVGPVTVSGSATAAWEPGER